MVAANTITPAVRLVLGFGATVERPLSSVTNPLTERLQSIVRAHVHPKAAIDESMFGVFPVPNSELVIVGYAWERAPTRLDRRMQLDRAGPSLTAFPFARTSMTLFGGPYVDSSCVAGVDDFLAYDHVWGGLGSSAEAQAFGLRIEPSPNALDAEPSRVIPFSPTVSFVLLSDDGRCGALVHGYSLWRRGDTYTNGRVRTWQFELDDGESARIVGVPLLEVSAERPAVRVPEALLQPNFDERAIREEVLSAGYTERPSSWWLVSEA